KPQTKEQMFNVRHAYHSIKCLFVVLEEHFRILNTPMVFDIDTQSKVVLVLCALHNFICHWANGEEYGFFGEANRESEQRYRTGQAKAFREGGDSED
ncbi:hypothetical protein FN846DRAFT_773169, partial [Sphaerosporella brunnea]